MKMLAFIEIQTLCYFSKMLRWLIQYIYSGVFLYVPELENIIFYFIAALLSCFVFRYLYSVT